VSENSVRQEALDEVCRFSLTLSGGRTFLEGDAQSLRTLADIVRRAADSDVGWANLQDGSKETFRVERTGGP
jgi:hypothetical protein